MVIAALPLATFSATLYVAALNWIVPPLLTVILKVCGAEVSTPPKAVPPLSMSLTVTIAVPVTFVAGVKVKAPVELTAGCDENRALLSFVTRKASVWADSLAGPLEIFVAHGLTVCA